MELHDMDKFSRIDPVHGVGLCCSGSENLNHS
jgi:hypothetical protein